MTNHGSQVILITGASSGIGQACAERLAEQGHRVYGTSRRSQPENDRYTMLVVDVTDADSIHAAVEEIRQREGRLDVVVNNAGIGYGGSVEDTSIDEVKASFETNFFGALRICRAVLPLMREQGGGKIVNVSSIGGLMGLPYQASYSATKYALEGMTEALRMEVQPFGIHVSLIEPGDIRTGFTANRRHARAAEEDSVYREQYRRTLKKMEADELGGSSPDVVAQALTKIVRSQRPRARYVVGPFYEKVAVWAKRLLPAALFEWIVMKNYDLT